MADNKDRLGDKLRDVERGREDQYFAQRDRELLEKMKQVRSSEAEAGEREGAKMHCPKCGAALEIRVLHEVTVDECSQCGGVWFDKGEFETLARRENEGWLGRLLRARGG